MAGLVSEMILTLIGRETIPGIFGGTGLHNRIVINVGRRVVTGVAPFTWKLWGKRILIK